MNGVNFQLEHNFQYGFIIKAEPVLTHGSLVLIEPARDSLTSIGNLKNYAQEYSDELTGGSTGTLTLINAIGNKGFVEKTKKGGLHCAVTSGPLNIVDNVRIEVPESISTYYAGHVTHSYAVFLHANITRNPKLDTGKGNNDVVLTMGGIWGTCSLHQARSTQNLGGQPVAGDMRRLGLLVQGDTNMLLGIGASSIGVPNERVAYWGGRSIDGSNNFPSWILYRLYIEDLTVSGRTFEEVSAIEQTIYKERFSVGGRYERDTFTPPIA